ncbi:tyrosine-type recombinase/integrase [Vibrio diazotrophicus]|uniref:Thymidylate synthase n=1 Tax=Vibrio diazotrophicus TaxID=685 RepID=A0ABX4WB88_VIBDI|nr:tyrosine-type recombinase/integrase [Vibrio diazotrophicus]PNI01217.1 thymidylate synthase [Vibrio diazotrophicus]
MDKLVVISSGKTLDVSSSVAHEDLEEYSNVLLLADGVAAFNEKMELLPLISDFLTHYRMKHSDKSVVTYGKNLCYLVKYLTTYDDEYKNSRRDDCLLTVHANSIQQYYLYCRKDEDKEGNTKTPVSARTIENRDATYASFFGEFLCNPPSGYKCFRFEENPYENGGLARVAKKSLIVPAQFSDVAALIQVAKHEREKCLIQFMYDSGLRRAEVKDVLQRDILSLSRQERNSLIVDEQTFCIPSPYSILTVKGNKGRGREAKYRNTIISNETINRVQKYNSSIEYKKHKRKWGQTPMPAFLNSNGNPYTANAVSKLVTKLSKRACKIGLINKPISPHKIRHGYGAVVLNSDDLGDSQLDRLLLLQQCLGHDSLDTTQEYTKIPVEVWDKFADSKGKELNRHELMKKLRDKTRLRQGAIK